MKHPRVQTGVIRQELERADSWFNLEWNPTYYYSWIRIYRFGGMGTHLTFYPRFNFSLMRVEAYR